MVKGIESIVFWSEAQINFKRNQENWVLENLIKEDWQGKIGIENQNEEEAIKNNVKSSEEQEDKRTHERNSVVLNEMNNENVRNEVLILNWIYEEVISR